MKALRWVNEHLWVLLLAVAFSAVASLAVDKLGEKTELIKDHQHRGTWALVQLEAEHLRLLGALDRYAAGLGDLSREELLARMEMLHSRLPVLLHGTDTELARALPGAAALAERLIETLARIEPDLVALEPGDRAAYGLLHGELAAFSGPIHALVMEAVARDTLFGTEPGLDRIASELSDYVLALLVFGLGLILVLVLKVRGTRRVLATATAAEATAEAARRRLIDAIESTTEGFALFDAQDRLILCNSRYRSFFPHSGTRIVPGATFEAMMRMSAEAGDIGVAPEACEDWLADRIAHHRNPGPPYEYELSNGTTLEIRETKTADGNTVTINNDITARLRAQRELAANQARIEAIAGNIPGLLFQRILRPDGTILYSYLSPSIREHYGVEAEELTANPDRIREIIHPEDLERWLTAIHDSARDMAPFEAEFRITRPSGKVRWMRAAARPHHGADGDVIGDGSTLDVTDLRRAQEERTALLEQLHQSQKMQALGTLAGGIAHDFNNILTSVQGNALLADQDLAPDHPARRWLTEVLKAGVRARDVVQRILLFSRDHPVVRQPVRVDRAVDEAVTMLRATLPSTIEIVTHIEAEAPTVEADPVQIEQLVVNLCVNASQAIGAEPGRISLALTQLDLDRGFDTAHDREVRLERLDQDRARIWLGRPEPGPYLKLAIRDIGCGMTADTLARIFEPFFTTKAPGEGTGLGLATVQGAVLGHGGGVMVETGPGAGTEVEVFLPQAPAADLAAEAPRPVAQPGHGRILLVDDEPQIVAFYREVLERLGYQVDAVTDSRAALTTFRADPGRWDLVLTDQTMPHLLGSDLAREVHSLRPGIPIVLCTGQGTAAESEWESNGIRAVLNKPITDAELAHALDQALGDNSLGAP